MSIRKAKYHRMILHAWLWRSQEGSPYYDEEKAEKIFDRFQVIIMIELTRVSWRDKVKIPNKKEGVLV